MPDPRLLAESECAFPVGRGWEYDGFRIHTLSRESHRMSEQRVIDVDGHVFEPESVWEDFLDRKYREQRPRIVLDNRGTTRYMLEGRLIPPGEGRARTDETFGPFEATGRQRMIEPVWSRGRNAHVHH